MSRITQYIGLNDYAEAFVAKALKVETYPLCKGMFGEDVLGRIYHMPPPDGPNKAWIFKEVVQATPWSSGPMIFTHLEATLVKESGTEFSGGFYFSWMIDPTVHEQEYDQATGRMYV